eukprot:4769736-Pyramimonas_sp.AAC.1
MGHRPSGRSAGAMTKMSRDLVDADLGPWSMVHRRWRDRRRCIGDASAILGRRSMVSPQAGPSLALPLRGT